MTDMNKVILIGKLGADPEIKRVKNNQAITLFPFVTSEVWTNAAGEARVRETWHRVAVFSEFLCRIARSLRKGSRCYIEGQLQVRKWHGKDGQPDTVSVEIVLQGVRAVLAVLDPPSERSAPPAEDGEDLAASPTPLSIKRSATKYGDGTDADDGDSSGLTRFLQVPDDHARAERRAAGEPERRA